MPSANRPSVRFRRIGGALRQARENAGLTIDVAGRRFGRSPGWMSTTENGLQPIRVDDLAELLSLYGVPHGPLRESLLHLAAQGRRKNWARAYEDRISPAAHDLASMEADSAQIQAFQPNLVPGLLQTADYARNVIATGLPSTTRNNAELLAFRMQRQAVFNQAKPPTFTAIIGEAVLHHEVGGATIMREQLRHLGRMAQWEHITLRVLPYSSSAYLWISGQFDILTLRPPGRLTVTVIEQLSQSAFIEAEGEVKEYEDAFAHVLGATLDGSLSLELIDRLVSGA